MRRLTTTMAGAGGLPFRSRPAVVSGGRGWCAPREGPGGAGAGRRGYAGSFQRKSKKKKKGEEEDTDGSPSSVRFDEELWKMRPQWVTLTRTHEQLRQEAALVKSYCDVPSPPILLCPSPSLTRVVGSASKLMRSRAYKDNAEMAKMLKLKLAALNELPPDLRAAALEQDVYNPPRERVIPLWTAPIPGYQESLPPEHRDEPFDFTKLSSLSRKQRLS